MLILTSVIKPKPFCSAAFQKNWLRSNIHHPDMHSGGRQLFIQAVELHMVLSCVAMGTIQMPALYIADRPANDKVKTLRYLRTPSSEIVSEATIMWYLQKYFFTLWQETPD